MMEETRNFTLNEDKSLQADFVLLFLFLFVFFSDLARTSHWGQEIAMGFGLERRQLRAQSGNKVCHTATTTTKKNLTICTRFYKVLATVHNRCRRGGRQL